MKGLCIKGIVEIKIMNRLGEKIMVLTDISESMQGEIKLLLGSKIESEYHHTTNDGVFTLVFKKFIEESYCEDKDVINYDYQGHIKFGDVLYDCEIGCFFEDVSTKAIFYGNITLA